MTEEIMVCIPTTMVPSVPSLRETATCGHEVYISVRTRTHFPAMPVICQDCALADSDPAGWLLRPSVAQEVLEVMAKRGES